MNITEYIESPLPIQRELDFFFNKQDALIIFDIGACEGEDSVRYKKLFKNAHVYSFEPLPKNQIKIRETLAYHGLQNAIEVFSIALSDTNGTAIFHVSSGTPDGQEENTSWDYGNKSSSLLIPSPELKKQHPWLKFDNQIEVQTQRLDFFCDQRKVTILDFIHMDVQGAELKVLTGAGRFLSGIRAIWLEVESVELYKGQPLKKEVELFMKEQGFIKLIDTVNHLSGDQFYYNKKYISSPKLWAYQLVRLKDKIENGIMKFLKK